MHGELMLLQRGQSVRRKRIVGRRLAASAKVLFGAAVTALAVFGWVFLRDVGTGVVDRPRPGRSRFENPEAMKLCKLARFHYYKLSEEGLAKAMDCFNQALEIDPRCVPGYAGIADLCVVSQPSQFLPPKAAEAKMRWVRLIANSHFRIEDEKFFRSKCILYWYFLSHFA